MTPQRLGDWAARAIWFVIIATVVLLFTDNFVVAVIAGAAYVAVTGFGKLGA